MEVQYNGIWGAVCDYGWDLSDAQVVCNQLGFGRATAAEHNAFYGEGSGQNSLYYLNCLGNELTIGNCSYSGWGYYCSPRNHAGVKCSSGKYVRMNVCMYNSNLTFHIINIYNLLCCIL